MTAPQTGQNGQNGPQTTTGSTPHPRDHKVTTENTGLFIHTPQCTCGWSGRPAHNVTDLTQQVSEHLTALYEAPGPELQLGGVYLAAGSF